MDADLTDTTTPITDGPLSRPGLYLNPELSLLAFHRRVMLQATREDVPLLERLRFLTISVTNLDEFFEVRVAALRQQATFGLGLPGPDGRTPREALTAIGAEAQALVEAQYRVLNTSLLPALRREGIRVLTPQEWSPPQRAWLRAYFEGAVLPILGATALDPARPFPNIVNQRLNYIVELSGRDAFGREADVAIVPVPGPRVLPRILHLPESVAGGPWDFVLLTSLIEAHLEALFPGMKVDGAYQFRLTRNSDLWVDEEEVDDLLDAIAGELPRRDYGDAVRIEVERTVPEHLARLLLDEFELGEAELYRTDGPVNLHRVSALHEAVDLPDLKYRPFRPEAALRADDPFARLRHGDLLLHHPYQSFQPVIELLTHAASDPDVVVIRMTLYRTGASSPIADALVEAARQGKDVHVIVELRARFDEQANISVAQRLKAAGAHVSYGVVGRKTHAKMLLITRREHNGLRSYLHLSTGNYHHRTAEAYTDLALLTAREPLVRDAADLFRQLTGLGQLPPPRALVTAPFALFAHLEALIEAEAEAARAGEPAWIRARMNSLSDPRIIRALYRAAQAGVEIDLIVRGMCSLRPGVPGVSERIRVRSIVGRFLEHSRVFAFCQRGLTGVWISSADWAPRNLHRRVELCAPIEDPVLKARLLDEAIDLYLQDAVDAWALDAHGDYHAIPRDDDGEPIQAQLALLGRHAGGTHARGRPQPLDVAGECDR